ncbi:hypothetical protein UCRPA7_8023 [Phaeoacremonium minimum UCRPA7]|uniref:Uncharacterized protein n=1 Tax=Phaeoacremonium minimum (strain UCR-PA7) TaxID=1286976 RepID=R8BAX4_PHAM7|nr:hypothetical protein UCRPA7_8023 [Phaeoacremonium minimum UCRPA7]EON96478.1 hypothetical protein UCRPA7_8023 [Phaeoacremonium minimum UCRPA7]
MPLHGVPQSVCGRVFDIQFTLQETGSENEEWDLKWKNKGPQFQTQEEGTGGVTQRAGFGDAPIDFDNDIIICRGIGDVFEECAEEHTQPPVFPRELREFITKFKVRLIPPDEADLVLNTLFYGELIEVDKKRVFFDTLFEYSKDEQVPLWAGVYWQQKGKTDYDSNGLPIAKKLSLTSLHEDDRASDSVRDTQPYNIWLDKWHEEGYPDIDRDFAYPAIVVVRDCGNA